MGEVGKEIRRLREAKGWGQTKLAAAADMAVSGVSQIENGRRNPNSATLVKLARALGVEVADFFPKAEAQLWPGEAPELRSALSPNAARLHAQMGARLAEVWGPELEEREEAGDLQWMMRVAQILADYGDVLNELLKNTTLPDEETAKEVAFMAMDLNAFFARVQEALPRVKEAQETEVRAEEKARR